MEAFSQTVMFAFVAIFAENIIFSRGLGTSTMLLAAKNNRQFLGLGLCITYICTASSMLSYIADKLFLSNETSYMYMPIIYIIIIGGVYILTLLVMWKWAYVIFVKMKKFVHFSVFNCAVLGSLLLNAKRNSTFLEYTAFGLCTGIGFMVATYLLSIVYERLNSDSIPDSFRGYPIILVYIGILSMAFFGLVGHQLAW